ncbi:hypothetical protein BCR34DRAFT_57224 [Clohesyomyces aquaticus]|uniref:LysM domain-containing protein n=1 Tax=Clohesyomyces aquaticus TaxID=1231657 RepID=A0A1Y1Z264_9PLEO|nr:hypothetical protein BCR34DRAFT_57224 [Clohesyomyces aquaticus]
MMLPTFVYWCTLFSASAVAQYQFYNLTTTDTNLSSTCVTVLNQAVTCNASIEWAGRGRFEDDETLQGLCTSSCTTSLLAWLRRASGACTVRYNDGKGSATLPALWVETVVENYNLTCLQNGGKFCNAVLRDGFGVDPNNQSKTKSSIATITCDDCFLNEIQTKLQMPLYSNSDLATTFTSLTSTCKKTGFSVTPIATKTSWVISTTVPSTVGLPTSTTCTGNNYTIKSGDTCNSIALSQGLSTGNLLDANKLQAFCAKFPSSGTLCIPASGKCKTQTVKTGDTCAKIADQNKVTWAQIVSWNPEFGKDCGRIADNVGYVMCISTPGGDWVNPSPAPVSTPTTITLPPFVGTEASLLPKPTFGGMINGSDIWTYTYAPGTRLDCDKYANVTDVGASALCETVAKGYGITVEQLVNWNPSLNTSCVFDAKLTYCVQPSILHVTNTTQYCTVEDQPSFGQTCDDFLALWDLDYETFEAFNPGIGSKCDKWQLGHSYCVMALHFRQLGQVSTCNKWDMANITNWVQDPCGIIETKNGLSHARFVAWNPSVLQNCTGIKPHNDYCVSIPNYKPTFTSMVASSSASWTNPLGTWWGPDPTSVGAVASKATSQATSQAASQSKSQATSQATSKAASKT